MDKRIIILVATIVAIAVITIIFIFHPIKKSAVDCSDLRFEVSQISEDSIVVSYSEGETAKTEKIGLGEEKEIIMAPSSGYYIKLISVKENTAKLQVTRLTGITIEGYDYSPKVCDVRLAA